MNSAQENNKNEKPADMRLDRDVLGLEKPEGSALSSPARPKRIFIVLALLVIMAILFFLFG